MNVTTNVTSSLGLQSIVIETLDNSFNLADVGYGFSQVLPILTKLWYSIYKVKENSRIIPKYKKQSMLLIEQPELHLHPALQAKIADAIIKCTQIIQNNIIHRNIVETHSQTIIERIGRRVREEKIDPQDINILLFSKDEKNKNTIIKKASFNEKGQLIDWPWGFFDPED